MRVYSEMGNEIKDFLKNDGIGVLPTDTIYGVVGSALSSEAVERIYEVKNRDESKPFIVLISSVKDIKQFDIKTTKRLKRILKKLWPGPVSIIIPCEGDDFEYIHRGHESIAFRLPEDKWLRKLIKDAGPLVAPSANISGKEPARDIEDAQNYFGEALDFYLDKGPQEGNSSLLLEIKRF